MILTFCYNVLRIPLKCFRFNVEDTFVKKNIILKCFYNIEKMFPNSRYLKNMRKWYNFKSRRQMTNYKNISINL